LHPIRALARATAAVEAGNLSARTGLAHGADEFGRLATAFDRMAGSLEQRTAARMEAEEALRGSEQRLRALVQHTADILLIIDPDGTIRYASPAASGVSGVPGDVLVGRNVFGQILTEDRPAAHALIVQALSTAQGTSTGELRLEHRDGSVHDLEVIIANLVEEAGVEGLAVTARDVTERKAYERQLTELAFHDRLTGLANRALFLDRLDHALTRAGRSMQSVAVLFIDLDNFKVVNDSLGHAAGDRLLQMISERLKTNLRDGDTLARFGGDEFTVLLDVWARCWLNRSCWKPTNW
jgi:PAS domain S-box-containing protein